MKLDKTDQNILNYIQDKFPVVPRPFLFLGQKFGISEEEVFTRIKNLKRKKIIRRIGANFDSRKLGFAGSLIAMKVPADRIDETVKIINSYTGITHNYLRDGEYNIWFTLQTESEKKRNEILREIKKRTQIKDLLNLPSKKIFKIRAMFDV
jgi:DNA-binding Lrp family transcriptional regulator